MTLRRRPPKPIPATEPIGKGGWSCGACGRLLENGNFWGAWEGTVFRIIRARCPRCRWEWTAQPEFLNKLGRGSSNKSQKKTGPKRRYHIECTRGHPYPPDTTWDTGSQDLPPCPACMELGVNKPSRGKIFISGAIRFNPVRMPIVKSTQSLMWGMGR